MAKYSASGDQNLSATAITALNAASPATVRRMKVYDLMVADAGTPADLAVIHVLQRTTASGTATAVTPTKLDMADPVASAVTGENHTVEPTYTAAEELLEVPINTRATFRWVSAPGSEIVTPATSSAGWGMKSSHASATTLWRVTTLWEE
mgnify:CR=1 FL=1